MVQVSPLSQERPLEQRSDVKPLLFEKERKHRLMQHLLWIASTVFWFFCIYNFLAHNLLVGWLTLLYACLSSIWAVLTYFYKSYRFMVWSSRLFTYLLLFILLYYISFGGPGNGYALWSYVYPMVTFFMLGKREGLVVVAIFWLLQCLLLLSPIQVLLQTEYAAAFKLRYLLSQVLVVFMTYIFESGRGQNQEKMHRQQCRLKLSESRAQDAVQQLKITQSQLVQSGKLASIGQLAAGVAHELNQPLMVIRGNAQLIKRQIDKPDYQINNMAGFLATIDRNTKRMGYIIDHLRSFSRQSPAEKVPVDINDVINNAFLMMREQLRLHGIEVSAKLQENLPKILGDANQLEQVILNLLTNARDALDSAANGTYGRAPRRITLTTRHIFDTEMVEIKCLDTGAGISIQSLDSIFDPFFTTKAVGKGTGLGLSISYGIVQNHNGQIKVTDTSPKGTTFQVLLPVVTADAKGANSEPGVAQNPTRMQK